jgi:hypothetical protein
VNADAQAHFVAKWHRREPEMALAEVFCPPPEKARFRGWGALVAELREAAFELSDPRVTAVKAPWWAEELLRFAEGLGRHPLAADLTPSPEVPWHALAGALLRQVQADSRPADAGAAVAQVRPLAEALAAVESALFPTARPSSASSIAVHLLLQRLPHGLGDDDQARLPMTLLARHGITAAQVAAGAGDALLRDWAAALLAARPDDDRGQPLFRRLRSGLDRVALRRLAAGRAFLPELAPVTVWRAWRIARRG